MGGDTLGVSRWQANRVLLTTKYLLYYSTLRGAALSVGKGQVPSLPQQQILSENKRKYAAFSETGLIIGVVC